MAAAAVLRLGLLAGNVARHPELFAAPAASVRTAAPPPPHVPLFGFEAANVARAWVCRGQGFSSPFAGDTGPTGWVSPGIVAVYAGAFAAFGCTSPVAPLALLGFALVLSLLGVLLAHDLARRLFASPRAGLWAAAVVAFWPFDAAMFASPSQLDLGAYGFLFLLLADLAVRGAAGGGRGWAVGFGLTAGLATLASPALAPVAVVLLAAAVGGPRRRPAGRLATVAVLWLLLVGPWIVFQHGRLGGWSFVKSNLPFELYLGNYPGVDGHLHGEVYKPLHPSQSPTAFADYRRLGERAFIRSRFAEFRARFEPARFAAATGRRIAGFFAWYSPRPWEAPGWRRWVKLVAGTLPGTVLVLWLATGGPRRAGEEVLLVLAIVAYAAPYLVTHVMPRYVRPIDGVLAVLGVGVVDRLWAGRRAAVPAPSRQRAPAADGGPAAGGPSSGVQ